MNHASETVIVFLVLIFDVSPPEEPRINVRQDSVPRHNYYPVPCKWANGHKCLSFGLRGLGNLRRLIKIRFDHSVRSVVCTDHVHAIQLPVKADAVG